MKLSLSIAITIFALTIFGARIYKKIIFKQNVTGYLKRAADANTVELAKGELKLAIDYLEQNELTEGYTSIIYRTPDEDIGFWYRNLKASYNELDILKTTSALEKTNVLIKLRETLVDGGERMRVTVPDGIHVFPNNSGWCLALIFALIIGSYGFIWMAITFDKHAKEKAKQTAGNET